MRLHSVLALATLPLFALSSGASSPLPLENNGEGSTVAVTSSQLERALDSVRSDSIEADLIFIASDQLAGRDTPSSGLRIAARFIRARLERLGWKPGAPEGYLYEYPLQKKRIDKQRTSAAFVGAERSIELEAGVDYCFSGRGLQFQERTAPLIYCAEGSRKDMDDLDLEGKLALISLPEGSSWFPPYRRAKSSGALGLVWTTEPEAEANPFAGSWSSWWQSLEEGRTGWPSNEEAEPGFTTLALSWERSAELFELAGFSGSRPSAGVELSVSFRDDRAVDPDSPRIPLENVCGYWPGSDPELSKEVLILSAHYDHVGVDDEEIYNGADDNGSGTCALLAIAEALVEYGPMRRSVMLIWVSGEEKGLLGSRAWAESPWIPDGGHAICDINIDMVGRNDPKLLKITPTAEHEKYNALTRLAESVRESEGFDELGSADNFYGRSDHAMFEKYMGLPICFLFSDVHEDYHKPTDTADKIDYDKIRRVSRLVLRMIAGLQTDELDL